MAEVCDPTVLPGDLLEIQIEQPKIKGFRLCFPSEWLLLDLAPELLT